MNISVHSLCKFFSFQQFVNQDSSWDVLSNPESSSKKEGSSDPQSWKIPINIGTELWENNLKNGGQPAAQQPKVHLDHKPSNNIGGTWGEDDKTENSNAWRDFKPNLNFAGN